jgi:hypothetical protein
MDVYNELTEEDAIAAGEDRELPSKHRQRILALPVPAQRVRLRVRSVGAAAARHDDDSWRTTEGAPSRRGLQNNRESIATV